MIKGVDPNLLGRNLLLLRDRTPSLTWPHLGSGVPYTHKNCNKFFLWGIINYHWPVEKVLEKSTFIIDEVLGDPRNIWKEVAKYSESEWMDIWEKHKTHRYRAGHKRIHRIGKRVLEEYNGKSRNIWDDQDAEVTLSRMLKLGVGDQISRMIVGALCDTKTIAGSGDVKVDVHVRRVLGRLSRGRPFGEKEVNKVVDLTRKMAENAWHLDFPLFNLGRSVCGSKPQCQQCPVSLFCSYRKRYQRKTAEVVVR